jgi:hypothetical protein
MNNVRGCDSQHGYRLGGEVVELGWWCACKVQNGKKGGTYSSALDSARAGLALLPAAAEANEGGAIVGGSRWGESGCGAGGRFRGHRFWDAECGNTRQDELVARAGERVSRWSVIRA